jgi:hypothetical protein
MPLQALWELYNTHGYSAVKQANLTRAIEHFYLALLAFGDDDISQALASAREAARIEPASPIFVEGAKYLKRVSEKGKAGVYVDSEAFSAFVRGGGNIELYESVSAALRAIYQEYETLDLLDIGVGDGLALLPALTRNILHLDIVEPSEALLAQTETALKEWGMSYHAYDDDIQHFITLDVGNWDIIQGTWSFQSIPTDERRAIFDWCRQHGKRLLIAEFDVPNFEALYSPERVLYVLDHYWAGLAEYAEEGSIVAQGFLMPVMFGYFDRSASRTNYEGPIQSWVDDVRAVGFEKVETRLLYSYWWADAYLIDAQ